MCAGSIKTLQCADISTIVDFLVHPIIDIRNVLTNARLNGSGALQDVFQMERKAPRRTPSAAPPAPSSIDREDKRSVASNEAPPLFPSGMDGLMKGSVSNFRRLAEIRLIQV